MNFGLSGFPHIAIGHMQRLSGLDASFLYLETAAQPLHVCSILELDTSTMPGGYTFDRMRDKLGLRSKADAAVPREARRQTLQSDHPVWVEDEDFDVDRHLHRIGLPSPGRPARCHDQGATLSSVVDTVKRARSGLAMARPFAAPQTPFSANVTGHRNIAYAQLDLDEIKKGQEPIRGQGQRRGDGAGVRCAAQARRSARRRCRTGPISPRPPCSVSRCGSTPVPG